jgi:uncharacterized HAD superfamily protein
MMKKKIGVDIDEVLASFVEALFDYHNKTRGTQLDKKEIKSNFFSDYMKFSQEETSLFLDEFFSSDSYVDIEPVFGSVEVLKKLDTYELIAITIRPEHWRRQTEEWLHKNFGNVFSRVYMLGLEGSSLGGIKQSKEDLSIELGLNLFIEDSLSTAKKIAEKGIPVILLDKLWNQGELPENVRRVATWENVLVQIESLV